MALNPTYSVGTVSVSAGASIVTGTGTLWLAGGIREGDVFERQGLSVTVLSVESNTQLTLVKAWPGTTGSGTYEVRYTADAARVIGGAREIIAGMEGLDDRVAVAQTAPFTPFQTISEAIAGEKPLALLRVSAVVSNRLVEWVRRSGGPCLEGGWAPAGEVSPFHFGVGTGDWQTAINAAISWISSTGGGILTLPGKGSIYDISAPIVMRSNVILNLAGNTIRLGSGANSNVIEGLGYQTLTGTNSGAGISEFSIINGVIDGNRAANTSTGHGIAFYGRNFFLKDLLIKNTRRRGLHSEYGNTTVGISPFNGRVQNLTFDTCGEEGWLNEVSDCQGGNLNFASCGQNADNTFDAMVMRKGSRISEGAIWRKGSTTNRHRYGVRLLGGSTVTMFNVETSATAAWRVEGEVNQVSDTYIYNNMGAANVEISGTGNRFSGRVGRSSIGELNAATVALIGFCAQNDVDIVTSGLAANAVLLSSYTGGYNSIRLRGSMDATGGLLSGAPISTDELDVSLQVGSAIQEIKKRRVIFNSIAAAGTTQATATALVRVVNNVTGADGTAGVALPTGYEGREISVANIASASALRIYPATGQIIAGYATNASMSLAAASGTTFVYNGGRWVQI